MNAKLREGETPFKNASLSAFHAADGTATSNTVTLSEKEYS
jgi:hypothetical protein